MESGESEIPAQLPVVQQTQVQPPSDQPVVSQQQHVPAGQPIMYQMASGQQQPVFIQVPAGQPATTPEGQPIQYYYVPVGQSVQPGQPAQPGQPVFVQGIPSQPIQPGQPVFVQGTPGQPAQSGQPVFVQGTPGQTTQPGQPVFVQGAPSHAVRPQRQPGQGGFQLSIDTKFLKSPLCFIKIAEFVTLLAAWASILKYLDMGSGISAEDEKADFFKGIMIFTWVLVTLYLIIYTLSIPKMCNFKQPSVLTISSLLFHFIWFVLLLACTGNLVHRAVDLGKIANKLPSSASKDELMSHIIALDVALAFGFLSCILFVVDMVLNYRLFQTQRAQETPPDQGPPQRRVWDINQEYLRSPVFYVQLVELAVLFAAWVCILKYFDMDLIKQDQATAGGRSQSTLDLSKKGYFRGITIFSWVMVILLALMFIFSLDKIRGHPSFWTLVTLLFYFFMFILLIACCGNLTPLAIEYGKVYKTVLTGQKANILALFMGLAFGFLSCILFVVDMVLNYRLFQTQRAQETPPDQGPPQRRVWDINQEYLKSPVFYVKLVEMAVLFAAWVCILKYFDMDIIKQAEASASGTYTSQPTLDLSKEEFFRGITIFSWVMVILLALTFIFSLDKICSRSSPWTLATLLFYIFLSILLIASCGNLTPLAVQLGKQYKAAWSRTPRKLNIIALFIGLGFGYIACITFIVDIALLYKLYRQQRMQEFPPQQASQQVVQQPAVVIMPQNMSQGAGKPFQPLAHPGQQSVQYPGQQHFGIGMAPPGYTSLPQQDLTRK